MVGKLRVRSLKCRVVVEKTRVIRVIVQFKSIGFDGLDIQNRVYIRAFIFYG